MATVVTVITIEFEFNEIVGVIGQGVTDTPHYTDTSTRYYCYFEFC